MSGKFMWQIKLSGQWQNYGPEENKALIKAYMSGFKNCKCRLRGQDYQYDFVAMEQINVGSSKRRQIRPPYGMKAPAAPVVPAGPTVSIVVPANAKAGDMLHIPHPHDPNVMMQVAVPGDAFPGAQLLVPVPPLPQQTGPNGTPRVVPQPGAPPVVPQPGSSPRSNPPTSPRPNANNADDANKDKDNGGGVGSTTAGMAGVAGVAVLAGGAAAAVIATDSGDAIADVAAAGADEIGQFAGDAGNFVMNLF